MVVGVGRMELELEGIRSLKEKRAVLSRILDRVRNRFDVSASEVGLQDVHQRALLAFAHVSGEGAHTNEVMDRVLAFAAGLGLGRVIHQGTELVHLNDARPRAADVTGDWSSFEETP
ncbi:MAG: cytoplasmic protein [Sandaracinus sp.]|nr:cytoplasmic protein [Sandaracinus sp.]|tara:strand:- start:883 stop:1233 length:351 start_codon:yes stop_codon:yes gene_type:complete